MSADEFLDELLRDAAWRFDEVVRLRNLLTFERDSTIRDSLRKSLVVILYSHFEGFCVFALEHYQAAINRAAVACRDATSAIIAGAWDPVFHALAYGDEKSKVFRSTLPNDAYLHRHWRRRHFVDELSRLLAGRVVIPDDVIDSESNLKPDVLRRNLFVLGLDHKFVDPHASEIHNLLGRRNRIAHGDERRGVQEREYTKYESAVVDICTKLIEFLDLSYRSEKYLRPTPDVVL